jgi:hypothetical protein
VISAIVASVVAMPFWVLVVLGLVCITAIAVGIRAASAPSDKLAETEKRAEGAASTVEALKGLLAARDAELSNMTFSRDAWRTDFEIAYDQCGELRGKNEKLIARVSELESEALKKAAQAVMDMPAVGSLVFTPEEWKKYQDAMVKYGEDLEHAIERLHNAWDERDEAILKLGVLEFERDEALDLAKQASAYSLSLEKKLEAIGAIQANASLENIEAVLGRKICTDDQKVISIQIDQLGDGSYARTEVWHVGRPVDPETT